MAANQWSHASNRRNAVRDAVEGQSYVGDHRRRARAQWRTTGSGYRVDGHDPSGAECGRPAQEQPVGSGGDHPQPVHFVPAGGSGAVSPGGPEHSREPPGSCDPARRSMSPPGPGSLASNTVVVNMMKRMNYKEGTGLGKNGQGIIDPIELSLRPKNAGLGTVEGSSRSLDEPPPSAENWPKWDDVGRAKKRGRYFTGPERNNAVRALKRDQKLGENVLARLLEKCAADAVVRLTKALALAASWSSGHGNLCYAEQMAAINNATKWSEEESASGTLTVGELICKFKALKEKYPQEYATFRVADTAREIVTPLLRSAFQQWEPLEDPSSGLLKLVNMLKDILLDEGSSAVSPYAVLVDDVVVEAVRASAAETWDARDHEPMFRFLETWTDALPSSAVQRLLEQVIVPKLAAAVESWEPRWDALPCHAWVLPWIPLLGRRLEEEVYATVRRKLGKALLGGWHAARAGADYEMVLPWKDAFSPAMWEEFVQRSVVPYLREGLRALRVAPPKQQEGAAFRAVIRWAPVVEARDMARLLDEEFFGRWLGALCRWLRAARPAVKEAVAWHEGWKRLLTTELLADERVRVALEAGLVMITRSAQGLEIDWPGRRGGQHAGEAPSCRYRSRRRGVWS